MGTRYSGHTKFQRSYGELRVLGRSKTYAMEFRHFASKGCARAPAGSESTVRLNTTEVGGYGVPLRASSSGKYCITSQTGKAAVSAAG